MNNINAGAIYTYSSTPRGFKLFESCPDPADNELEKPDKQFGVSKEDRGRFGLPSISQGKET